MSGGAKKFGAFGGVFTPSILTILGVIMYLRLPWVVGNAGLYWALAIVIVAHLISVTTGLSISSIATDKRVGAGGPYYVISRSLGLPMGGTIGLALFIGLSFSISLYIIGFSESFIPFIGQYVDGGLELSLTNIRLFGTGTVVLLTIITFISTSLAIKTQYIILAAIVLSLVSIGMATGTPPAEPLLEPPGELNLALLFGIFFPAVTGFTAGVNMSGDLKDPKSAIPRGTIAAVGVGLVVYVSLSIFLAYRVVLPTDQDPELLVKSARWGVLVLGGIWGATLSSALGSILGAPRILQSMSADGVTPRFFAKGTGATNEPRRALLLAFLVGEAGILIGELDAIARVVSMVFLALYAVINISFAVESWVSPDFRPSFRISKWVGVVGASTCALVMIQLDPMAMAGSVVLLLGLFAFLSRRRLALDSGDAWEGVWSSLVRTGLRRLVSVETHQRNWKPNLLAFTNLHGHREEEQRVLTTGIIGNIGIASEFTFGDELPDAAEDIPDGLFEECLPTPDPPLDVVETLARHHGFAGVRPNTILVPWNGCVADSEGFVKLGAALQDTDQNLLVFAGGDGSTGTIDVWWYDDLGNLALGVTLARLLLRSDRWRKHKVRVLLLTKDPSNDDLLSVEAREYARETRLDAEVLVRHVPPTAVRFQDVITEESAGSALVIVPLPETIDSSSLVPYEEVKDLPGHFLGYRAESIFERVLTVGGPESLPPPSLDAEAQEAVALALPEHPKLAEIVSSFDERVRELVTSFHARGVSHLYDTEASNTLARSIEPLTKELEELDDDASMLRLTEWFETATQQVQQAMGRLAEKRRLISEVALETVDPDTLLERVGSVVVGRRKEEFDPHPDDTPELRATKRRRRWGGVLRGMVKLRVPLATLEHYYHQELVREVLDKSLRDAFSHHHDAVLGTGRALSRLARDLLVVEMDGVPDALAKAAKELERITQVIRERRDMNRRLAQAGTRERVVQLSADVQRLDVDRFVRRNRTTKGSAALTSMDRWEQGATLLWERAQLGSHLGSVTQEIRRASAVLETKLIMDVLSDVREGCARLRQSLETIKDEGSSVDLLQREQHATWDPRGDLDEFAAAITDAADELPERFVTCGDEVLRNLAEGGELAELEVPLRRGIDAAARHELLSRVEEVTKQAHNISTEARTTLDELAHMVAFQRRAQEEDPDPEALASALDRAATMLDDRLRSLDEAEASLHSASQSGRAELATVANAFDLEALRTAGTGRRQKGTATRKQVGRGLLDGAQRAIGGLLYRRSHGVLLAMKLRTVSERAAVQSELRRMAREAALPRNVADVLPPFYQQLFLGRGAPGGPFRLPRETSERLGPAGTLIVTGEPGSGKTSVIQQFVASLSPPQLVWVQSPTGGSVSVVETERALTHGSRFHSADELLPRLVDGSVIVIDDFELWWERREGGLQAVEHLLDQVDEHSHRLRFVIGVNQHAYNVLDRLVRLTASANAVETCHPFSAQDLRHAIMRRHRSTGLRFTLEGRPEDSLGELAMARLFSAHFDAAAGNMAAALRGWLAHVESCEDQDITIRRPTTADWSALDALDADGKTLLLQLILHKEASRGRIRRILGQPDAVVDDLIRELTHAALVVEHPSRGFALNPYIQHHVIRHFRGRGLV